MIDSLTLDVNSVLRGFSEVLAVSRRILRPCGARLSSDRSTVSIWTMLMKKVEVLRVPYQSEEPGRKVENVDLRGER